MTDDTSSQDAGIVPSDLLAPQAHKPLMGKVILAIMGVVFVVAAVVAFKMYQERQRNEGIRQLLDFVAQYHDIHRFKKRGPIDYQELVEFNHPEVSPKPHFPQVAQQIADGRIIVIWKGAIAETGPENDKYLLAYENDDSKERLMYIMAGGTIQYATRKEIEKIPPIPEAPADPKDKKSD